MILGFVQLCYNSVRQPFANQGAVKIQNLNSERPALKIVRAVLRDSDVDPDDAVRYSLHRCYCKSEIKIEDDDEDETFNPESTLDELEIKEGDSVFIRKIDDRVDEMQEEQGEFKKQDTNSKEHLNKVDRESMLRGWRSEIEWANKPEQGLVQLLSET